VCVWLVVLILSLCVVEGCVLWAIWFLLSSRARVRRAKARDIGGARRAAARKGGSPASAPETALMISVSFWSCVCVRHRGGRRGRCVVRDTSARELGFGAREQSSKQRDGVCCGLLPPARLLRPAAVGPPSHHRFRRGMARPLAARHPCPSGPAQKSRGSVKQGRIERGWAVRVFAAARWCVRVRVTALGRRQ